MKKKIFIGITILIVSFSCNVKSDKTTKSDNEKLNVDTFITVKKVIEMDTLINVIEAKKISDTINLIISREFVVPKNENLKHDSSFYYEGVFFTFLERFTNNRDTIRNMIKRNQAICRIQLRTDGDPRYGLYIDTISFKEKTPYQSFFFVSMLGLSDIDVVSLIGVKNNGFELVFSERGAVLDEPIIKDSIMYLERYFMDWGDTVEVNLYTKKVKRPKLY